MNDIETAFDRLCGPEPLSAPAQETTIARDKPFSAREVAKFAGSVGCDGSCGYQEMHANVGGMVPACQPGFCLRLAQLAESLESRAEHDC